MRLSALMAFWVLSVPRWQGTHLIARSPEAGGRAEQPASLPPTDLAVRELEEPKLAFFATRVGHAGRRAVWGQHQAPPVDGRELDQHTKVGVLR